MVDYKKLRIWSEGVDLVKDIYDLTKSFPQEEIYGLTSQMRRAAVSVPCNIAEGSQRGSRKDFSRFLTTAKGSCAELDTQIIISHKLDLVTENVREEFSRKIDILIRSISRFRQSQQ